MTYRSIFVHVEDDSKACAQRLSYATRLAAKYPAEIIGGYLTPPSELTPYAKAVMSPDTQARYHYQRQDAKSAAEASFRDAASKAGVTSIDWRAPTGNPIGQAVLHSRHADLAVLGQPRDDPTPPFATELANAVLMRCGRPVLFVPVFGEYPTIGERVLIAWKDSREAARAIVDALPLLKDAKKVLAVAVAPEDRETAKERFTDAQVASFLRRHNVEVTVRRIVAEDISAGELLLSEVADVDADLIVMGAYSRPRLSELVWGSVTQVMLSSMTVPVLMSH
jgi:nucleotide-binding universal stress UspA family protein